MKRKTKGFWVSIISIAVLLVGIGGVSAPAADKVTLRYADTPYGGPITEQQEEYLRKFMEKYPNIEVKVERTDWGRFEEKLRVQAAADNLPDVFYLQGPWVSAWVQQGWLIDLTPLIQRDAELVELDDFFSIALEPYQWKGGLYGLPMDMGPEGIHGYNLDLFDKAGLSHPTKDWTLEGDFFAAVGKLSRDLDGDGENDQWGWSSDPKGLRGGWSLERSYLMPFGGRVVNDDETECLLTMPESIKGIKWWMDLILKYNYSPTPVQAGGFPEVAHWNMFGVGKLGMVSTASWTAPELAQFSGLRWDAMHAPKGPAGRFSATMGSAYSIPKTTKHPEEAWTFLRDWTSREGLTFIWALSGSGSVARKSGWLAWEETVEVPKNLHIFYEVMEEYGAVGGPLSPAARQVETIINREFDLILLGKKTVEEAVETIKKETDPLLAGAE